MAGPLFSPRDRQRLREQLTAAAQADARITAAALVGSSALGREDRWSDIDLALRVEPESQQGAVVAEWTDAMYAQHGAVHHTDLSRGSTLYRVFLRFDTLQVDLSFWPGSQFRATGPGFQLLFGAAAPPASARAAEAQSLIGMGWLYALHARSSLARGRVWQAEYMISALRDQVLTLACLRHGLPTAHARGFDDLPALTTVRLASALPASLEVAELRRALAAATEALLDETGRAAPALADRLAEPLRTLAAASAD